MLVQSGATEQNEYLDKCVRFAISNIANLNSNSIKKMALLSKEYYAQVLSQISVLTKITLFILDNYSSLTENAILSMLENESLIFTKVPFDNANVVLAQSLVNEYTSSLMVYQESVASTYEIDPAALSLYNYDVIEAEIDFSIAETALLDAFRYYNGKISLKHIIDTFQLFSNMQEIYSKNKKSISTLSSDKSSDVLTRLTDSLAALIDNLSNIEMTFDAFDITVKVFDTLNLSNSKYHSYFLNRKYDIIKSEVINIYFG